MAGETVDVQPFSNRGWILTSVECEENLFKSLLVDLTCSPAVSLALSWSLGCVTILRARYGRSMDRSTRSSTLFDTAFLLVFEESGGIRRSQNGT